MKWFSTIKIAESYSKSLKDAAAEIKAEFGPNPPDLALIFASANFKGQMIESWSKLRSELPVKNVVGCTAGGVIGGGREIEHDSAVSVVAARLPGVKIGVFDVRQEDLPGSDGSPRPWRTLVKVDDEAQPEFLLLSDPFSLDADALTAGLDFAFPQSVKIGGLASGGAAPHENVLIANDKIMTQGAVGVSLAGNISIQTIVAQGCRPIGQPLTITACNDNLLVSVNNRPPVHVLYELYESLPPRDQELLQTSLFLGIVMDPFNKTPKQGDYLIRNIVGIDQEQGVLAIGALIRPGQTVQFHLRDANTSREDLRLLLEQAPTDKDKKEGAVLFSCLGRGQRLYGEPDHDTMMLRSIVGDLPVGGFFCNGEIGPVGGKTYLHGYTSSIALFGPRNDAKKKAHS